MNVAKKCANPACTCIPPDHEKYCGMHCEALRGSAEIMCKCGHPECGGGA